MKPADVRLLRELKMIAAQDNWSPQRTKSMIGILKSTPEGNRRQLIAVIRERRNNATN